MAIVTMNELIPIRVTSSPLTSPIAVEATKSGEKRRDQGPP